MNLLESAIGALSPAWALRRAQARAALEVLHGVRGYDAGALGRRAGKWIAPSSAANAEIAPVLSRVRNRSRDMVRNNPYARSAITKLVSREIGTGILARWPKAVQPVWKEFVETADFEGQLDLYGLQSLAGRTVHESGACLVRRIRTRDRVPLKIQLLEPDYLDETKFGPIENGNFAISGIEIDKVGRVVAYWLFDHHPGELVQLPKTWQSRRYPASEVLYIFEKERPGQLHGMPRLAASMMRLRDIDEYQDAMMMRKKIEACFAAFVKSTGSSRTLAEAANTKTDDKGRRIETLSPGIVWYGQPGEEVTFGGAPGALAADTYTQDQLHAVAAGAGVTYEQLTGDFSKVTYLSARGALLEYKELVEVFRWIHFIPMFCRGVARWFVDAAYTAGRVRTDVYDVDYTPPAWPWIDPEKDIAAAKEEVKAGFASQSEKQRERGRDPEELRQEIKSEREENKKAGLVFDVDVGVLPAPSAKPGDAGGEGSKPEKPEEGGEKKEDRSVHVSITNTVPEREVHVHGGETRVEVEQPPAPKIDVHVPAQEAPKVEVHVPQQPAPVVKVEAQGRALETEQTIERDANGDIKKIMTRTIR